MSELLLAPAASRNLIGGKETTDINFRPQVCLDIDQVAKADPTVCLKRDLHKTPMTPLLPGPLTLRACTGGIELTKRRVIKAEPWPEVPAGAPPGIPFRLAVSHGSRRPCLSARGYQPSSDFPLKS